MIRDVGCSLGLAVSGPTRFALQITVARDPEGGPEPAETLTATLDGQPLPVRELRGAHHGRVHVIECGAGRLEVDYVAVVVGRCEATGGDELDLLTYLQPSRYCESDRLHSIASAEFGGLGGVPLVHAVSDWVGSRLVYEPGSSSPTDGAVATLLAGRGVCRDYAHLTVAFLRALEVPARVVAVYAPGVAPMDFHAVVEAYVDGVWLSVDPTLLAPRQAMVRIATGSDAASTAFISHYGAPAVLETIDVRASSRGDLPVDAIDAPATLG